MQIQQRWLSCSLSKAVRHSHGSRLLQTEYIFEIGREVLKKRLLCRTGVPEDGGQPQLPQEAVGCVIDGESFLLVTHVSLQDWEGLKVRPTFCWHEWITPWFVERGSVSCSWTLQGGGWEFARGPTFCLSPPVRYKPACGCRQSAS